MEKDVEKQYEARKSTKERYIICEMELEDEHRIIDILTKELGAELEHLTGLAAEAG